MFRPLRDRRFGSQKRSRAAIRLLLLIAGSCFAILVVVKTFAPVIGLSFLALAIFYGRREAQRQSNHFRRTADIATLTTISPHDFERHVAHTYERQGYNVILTPKTGDQGVDVIATSSVQRLGIQCKRYIGVVGNDAVQQALAGKGFYNCSHAVVVTTGTFTPSALALAAKTAVHLVDGRGYSDMLRSLEKPQASGLALGDWVPRGRARIIQGGLVVFALLVFATNDAPVATLPDLERAVTQSVYERPNDSGPISRANTNAAPRFDDRVLDFYSKLNARDFKRAYAMLSPSFRHGSTYTAWKAGYDTTESVDVQLRSTGDAAVNVSLLATDRVPTGRIVRRFIGSWRGIRGSDGQWYLDDGHFVVEPASQTLADAATKKLQPQDREVTPEAQREPQRPQPVDPRPQIPHVADGEATAELANTSRSIDQELDSLKNTMNSASGPAKVSSNYESAASKMLQYWEKEQQAAAVSPMTCFQKSQVQYIATEVAYELSEIKYVNSQVSYLAQAVKPDILSIERDLAAYATLASRYDQQYAGSRGADSSLSLENRAAAQINSVKAQLNNLAETETSYNQQGAALTSKAREFGNSFPCAG